MKVVNLRPGSSQKLFETHASKYLSLLEYEQHEKLSIRVHCSTLVSEELLNSEPTDPFFDRSLERKMKTEEGTSDQTVPTTRGQRDTSV